MSEQYPSEGPEIRFEIRERLIGALLAGLHIHLETLLARDAENTGIFLAQKEESVDLPVFVQQSLLKGIPEDADAFRHTLRFAFTEPNKAEGEADVVYFDIPLDELSLKSKPFDVASIRSLPEFNNAYAEIHHFVPGRSKATVFNLEIDNHGAAPYLPHGSDNEPLDSISWYANNPDEYEQELQRLKNASLDFIAPLLDVIEHWPELPLGHLQL